MKRGYITVYLSLVTGILLSLMLTVIEGVRMHTIRTQTEIVADMAMDSALAEYNRELLEQYDLFFIDISYGSGTPSYANLEEHIRSYMNLNFQPYEFLDVEVGLNLTDLNADSVELLQAAVATDDGGAVLQRQAIDYMKYRWGLTLLEDAAENAGLLESSGYLDSDMEAEWAATEQTVKERILDKQQEEDEDWEGQNVQLPSDVVSAARSEGILSLAIADTSGLSQSSIATSQLYSSRSSVLEGTGLPSDEETPSGVVDICIFQRYIAQKCGYYGEEKDGSAFSYQMEYILSGASNDLDNLRKAANKLLLVREASNVAYLFSDSGKKAEAEATATLITGVLMLPELAEPVTYLILFAWAYAESVKDLRILFDGYEVPIIKSDDSWNTPYSQLLTFRNHLSEYDSSQSGLNYEEYLEAFLYLVSLETKTERLMDVIEADIRLTDGNAGFRIDGCVDYFTANAAVSSGYGYNYTIERSYRYE